MRVFISGPMTGLPDYNLPAFAGAKKQLDALGFVAVNPGEPGVIDGYEWSEYMRDGIHLLVDCDGVALLDGWERSTGAQLEVRIAHALGMRVAPRIVVTLRNSSPVTGWM